MSHHQNLSVILGAGASSGVGGALARRFAAGGAPVLIAGRTQSKLDALVDEITKDGGKAQAQVCDVTDAEQVKALFDTARAAGPIGSVLYNAGNNAPIPFKDLDAKTFEQFWRVCTLGAFHVAKEVLPDLEAQGEGSLLFTGASASTRGRPNFGHFASAKAALRNLAQALGREFGPKGVHVGHVVIDGVVNGEMVRSKYEGYIDSMGDDGALEPDAIAEAFWQMHMQHRSAWSHEIDLRPYKENW